ncbi:lipopolysaccharide biosynthesis protein [Granulicella arctica]|uniref:PST family polysaccharide transporter n=1 Tax=Granulicella arctica TaxID=940613 RepID=A0A7Y9PHD5_9BACT|nr:lipopolysaccharide biosynthesis protein [Granulicella arctica]NYF79928.1 PST family polysaccharide transporter [Granulicella arctica]
MDLPRVNDQQTGQRQGMTETDVEEALISEAQSPPLAVVGRQTARGGTWMVGARLISRVIDLGTMLVLAHILSPKDFGLVAIAMTVIYIVEASLELPLSQALVRLQHVTQAHYDTAFTLSLIRGLALTVIVGLTSWPFSRFYTDSRLLPLVIVLSLAPAARGLVSPRLAKFSRELDFSPDFMMEFAGKMVAFLIAVILAVTTRSYWAIAAGTIAAPVTGAVISYVLAPYRPRLSLAALPAFSGFLGWITAAQVISAFNWQTDKMLMGKLTSRTELGLFAAANDASNIPVMALLSPIMRPLHAAFSLLRHDIKRLANSYQNSASGMLALGLPILVMESLVAYPAVRLLFGEKWMGSAPLLRWLAISLIPSLFAAPLGALVMAFGRTQIFFRRNLFEVCIKLPLVVLGAIKMGFMGVVLARCVSETLTVVFSMVMVRRLIGLSIRQQLLAPWRSLVAAAAMALVVAAVLPKLTPSVHTVPLAMSTLGVMMLGVMTYGSALWGLWILSGRPSGLEAMVNEKVMEVCKGRVVAPSRESA